MLCVQRSRGEIEAEQIVAVLFRLRMRIREVRTPTGPGERAVERDALPVVPEALSDGIVDDDRPEVWCERAAAGAGRGDVRNAALGAHHVIAERCQPRSEGVSITDVVLR